MRCSRIVLHSPVRPSWASDGDYIKFKPPVHLRTGLIPSRVVPGRDGLWSTAVDCQGTTKIVHIVLVTFLLLKYSGAVLLSPLSPEVAA